MSWFKKKSEREKSMQKDLEMMRKDEFSMVMTYSETSGDMYVSTHGSPCMELVVVSFMTGYLELDENMYDFMKTTLDKKFKEQKAERPNVINFEDYRK